MKKPSLLNRLREKKAKRNVDISLTWYDEDSWARIKSSAIDAERFEKSYSEWLEMAMSRMAELRNQGFKATPHHIDADEFLHWCFVNNRNNDAASRTQFVNDKLLNQGNKLPE